MTAFAALMAFQRETEALAAIAERLGWDQETMMPRAAAPQRAEEMAAIEGVLHARRTDPRLAQWLHEAQAEDDAGAAQLRLIGRAHARASRVPSSLAQALARATSLAQGVWAEARAADDPAPFLPHLTEILALRREEAAALAGPEQGAYDALLDDYEPGTTSAEIAALFDVMRPRLVELRARILERSTDMPLVSGAFPAEAQLALAREVATAFGYDWTRGRIDLAVHPFSSGGGLDSRITTRVVETDPFNCLYSTIHEVGHSSYELNIAPAYALTPLGHGVSMGVHESQSRIYENQIGRSRAFTSWLYARMTAQFGATGVADAEAFYRAVNRVESGFIRTEADEVHYNLHIMLRFDLERALIAGDLAVADLETAWNDRFAADFGRTVPGPARGVLQDVHWSCGLFGYFPTYTLGNVYAGCLHARMRADLPDLDADLEQGRTGAATGWLCRQLQVHGGLRPPRETMAHAIGAEPSAEPFLTYLETKFGEIYAL